MASRPARAPTVALSELLTGGYLTDADVRPGGHVDEQTRIAAERAHAEYCASSRRRARPLPPSPRGPTRRPPPATHRPARALSTWLLRPATPVLSPVPVLPPETERTGCVVCFTGTRDHALAPCFHMCVCAACATRLDRCPLCRADVTSVHRIYA